jgi:hypothetical protein
MGIAAVFDNQLRRLLARNTRSPGTKNLGPIAINVLAIFAFSRNFYFGGRGPKCTHNRCRESVHTARYKQKGLCNV